MIERPLDKRQTALLCNIADPMAALPTHGQARTVGVSFAKDLYPFVSDRPFTDTSIDVLLPKSELPKAREIMGSSGFS